MLPSRWMAALLVAASCSVAPAAGADPGETDRFRFGTAPGRLSKDVRPQRYRLELELDPARDDFAGRAQIELDVRRPIAAIELHAHELNAGEALLVQNGRRRALAITADKAAQLWRLAPADGRPIAAGRPRLEMRWRGRVQSQGIGLYRAETRLADGTTLRSLATQLQAIYARQVFPSFDEPAFRARFDVSVHAPAGDEALSNMPRRRLVADGTGRWHHFATTPPMPSYLVALAVGRYDVLEGRAAGVPLRILTVPGKRDQGRVALAATQQLLPFYARYFGLPYALPRLDQVAVASTRWGAMEDWGLISYAENLLLVDPATSSESTRRNVYSVVAHEVAHQWFGNLVTAASWNEIWLNEAFAQWMGEKASDRFNPGWQLPLNKRGDLDETMALDAADGSRAIRSGPVRETSVNDVFDEITYTKGGAVLGMIEQWLGEETFRRGLAGYMRDRRLSNATAGDLWHHVGRAAGRDVAAMAASWTDQPGFPLVRVEASCEDGRTRVALAQERFRLGPIASGSAGATPAPRWQVPVRLARGADTRTVLLADERASTTLAGCSDEPARANAGGVGFYRVAYAPAARDRLRDGFARWPAADRVALLADILALAQSGELTLAEGLRWLARIPQVHDAGRVPLVKQAIEAFDLLDGAFAGAPQQAALRESARSLLGAEFARLGWEPRSAEDPETLAIRARLVRQLARMDDAGMLAEARERADLDEQGSRPLHASLRDAVLVAAGAAADRSRFEARLGRLERATAESERWTLARSLAGVRDPALVQALLDRAVSGSLPTNIASVMPALVADGSPHGALAYRHLLDHWDAWARVAGDSGKRWLLPETAKPLPDAALAQALVDDQARLVGPDGAALAARAAAHIGQLVALRARADTMRP